MDHLEILKVASQLDSVWKYIRDFWFDLNFLFYKQFKVTFTF